MKVLLNEGVASAVMIYLVVKRMALPFEDWDAYKLGIIDKEGKKLKDPSSSKERESWTLFDRFIWNLRKILTKFVGQGRLAAILTTAYLLKDSQNVLFKHDTFLREVQEELAFMSCSKQLEIYNIIKKLDENLLLLEGEETAQALYRHVSKVAQIYTEQDIKKMFGL